MFLKSSQPKIPARNLALTLLFIASVFNYTDRYMLAVLVPAIKEDLLLSDTQIGFITGIAFTIFYVVMGIPIARLADKYNRKNILSIALCVWSLMTALCGLVQSFIQLMFARIMVGVGESGASPASYSIISDYFPARKRTGAISVYLSGGCGGILIGFSLGGWLVEAYSWRIALLLVGAAGVAFSLLLYKFLIEPSRGQSDGVENPGIVPLKDGIITLLSSRTFRHAAFGCALYNALLLAYVNWLPSFFVRTYDIGIGEIGSLLALVLGISQFVGYMVGGTLTDHLAKINVRWNVRFPAIVMLASTPVFTFSFTLDTANEVLLCLCIPLMIGVMQVSAIFAITQVLVDVRMRAVASGVLILILNVISGLGPFVVGIISDLLAPSTGMESLRYTLLGMTPLMGIWASFHYFRAERYIHDDLVR